MSLATMIALNQPIAPMFQRALQGPSSGCLLVLPHNLILIKVADLSPTDVEAAQGDTQIGVMKAESFLLVSTSFGKLNFDGVWSPIVAKASGEALMAEPSPDTGHVFNFVLMDEDLIVRNIRSSAISADCARAMWAGQKALMEMQVTEEQQQQEMMALFERHPGSIPATEFDVVYKLGTKKT